MSNNKHNGQRDEPSSVGGGNCMVMQFSVPTDRAERSPKGVGSIEFDRWSAFGAEPIKLNRSSRCPISGAPKAVRLSLSITGPESRQPLCQCESRRAPEPLKPRAFRVRVHAFVMLTNSYLKKIGPAFCACSIYILYFSSYCGKNSMCRYSN